MRDREKEINDIKIVEERVWYNRRMMDRLIEF